MNLSFEYGVQTVGTGHDPQAVHDNLNRLRVFCLDADDHVKAYESMPNLGLYDTLYWYDMGRCSPDENVSLMSLKRAAHHGAYGFWSAEGEHKFVVYMLPTDISSTFISGSTSRSINQDSASLSLNLVNIKGEVLNRSRALVTPNVKLELYFAIGGDEIPMGVYFVDRASVSYPEEKVSIDARDVVGKLLKEQTFDENNVIDEGSTHDNIEAMMRHAEVEKYFVGDNSTNTPLEFDPDTTVLEGIKFAIENFADWIIRENMDGTVGVARRDDVRFDPPTLYDFQRDHTCWSYSIEYDDKDAAARVCAWAKPAKTDETTVTEGDEPIPEPQPVRVYRAVQYNKWWEQPLHRTLYIQTADGATEEQCAAIAETVAESLAASGRTETFATIFTPQLVIGDEVRVTDERGKVELVGTVTDISHNFGVGGFTTSFTVDSGGRRSRTILKNLIQTAADFPEAFTGLTTYTANGDGVSY